MTATDLRSWLETFAEAGALVPASEVLKRLPVGTDSPHESVGDLTLEQVATEVGRAVSTIRTWCNSKKLAGAYRLNRRDWRVPRASLRAFLDAQGREVDRDQVHGGDADWGDWRTLMQ